MYRQRRREHRHRGWRWLLILVLAGAYGLWAVSRPLPAFEPVAAKQQLKSSATQSQLAWPAAGQAAVGVVGTDILETRGAQTPAPTASTAKTITALVVLDKKPLAAGEQGPSYTITQQDVSFYRNHAANDGSNLPVTLGQKLSLYQMVQALMLPSANNIADSLAIWTFGSLKEYSAAANSYLKSQGIKNTTVGEDASGLSPTTTSTAADLVKIGQLAMKQPALAEIVAQKEATGLPGVPVIRNVNSLLGQANVVGIKTGNTNQAGGVFISASKITLNNRPVTVVTAVMAAPNRPAALASSLELIKSAHGNFAPTTVVEAGDTVGQYNVPWGGRVEAIADRDLTVTAWKGRPAAATVELKPSRYDDRTAGNVIVPDSPLSSAQLVPVSLKTRPVEPSIWWRLTNPLKK